MNASSNQGFPAGNPIANAIVIIVGALAIGASLVLGFFAFVVLASLLIVFAAVIGIRVWWYRFKLRRSGAKDPSRPSADGGVIEGEYRVIVEERRERRE